MIDPRIIQLLDSRDVDQRKKAVTALARSKDPDALKYLARVYKEDQNPEVRELARKGGLYIRNNAAVARPDTRLYANDADDDVYTPAPVYYDEDDDQTEVDSVPLPSELHVSEMDRVKAQGFVNQAIDWNIRGNNEKAGQYLARALKANPLLMHDGYTVTLAATITGIDGEDAVRQLGPDSDELWKRAKSATANKSTALEGLLAYTVLVGAVLVLVSYFLFPWIDLSSIETVDSLTGQQTTLGESLEQFNALLALVGGPANTPEITQHVTIILAQKWIYVL